MPEQTGYRITAWPPSRLPLPLLWRRVHEIRDGVLVPVSAGELVDIDGAGETYLKLGAIDLDDEGAILAFANEFGILGVRFGNPLRLIPLDPAYAERAAKSLRTAKRRINVEGFSNDVLWTDERPPWAETLEEFRYGATALRYLTGLWRVAGPERLHPNRLEWAGETPGGAERETARVTAAQLRAAQRDRATDFLRKGLTPGLEPFHPRLVPVGARLDVFVGDNATLYQACALELFNHISEEATYETCLRCKRLFVRQEGRAKLGQYRTSGVRYCSERCLRAAKQRDYRARQRQRRSDDTR